MTKSIRGKVVFQNLGTGMWGIVDQQGNKWQPINFPEQLKYEGTSVSVRIRELDDMASIFMWGTPVRIVSFSTLMPS